MYIHENIFKGCLNRVLQVLARFIPGATTFRVWLNRWRGVRIGKGVWIGYDVIIESAYPYLVEIHDNAVISIRTTIIAHFLDLKGVVIGEGAFLGPGAIILPNVKVGKGAVVAAGSVVTTSISPMTLVQGNPAKPVAKVGLMLDRKTVLNQKTSMKQFQGNLRYIRKP
jgi:acetyltransferase-like isoleucine patch superfamily enzyme